MLNLTIQDLEDVTVFHCAGRILAGDAIGLSSAVIARSDMRIVLDLAEIRSVDAAGLGTLVDLQNWAKANGRQLKLMNLSPRLTSLLHLTKLDGVFEVCSIAEMVDLICRAARLSVMAAAVPDLVNATCPTEAA
jgi:anti-anti-sigma factor